jgi:hypothetical protein
MGKAIYTLGNAPTVSIKRCAGDLVIEGRAGETVTVSTDTMPHSVQDREQLVIEECDDDLRLNVPREATVRVDHVDGDARADGLLALEIGGVSGDLELRDVGRSCAVRSVDGDLRAIDVMELSLGTVGGDLNLERVTGRIALERTGGDAVLRGALGGFGPAHIGGDLTLDTSFASGQEYRATVDGDAVVYVPEDADLTLSATVDGDVSGVPSISRHGAVSATWGDGSAHLTLAVGGDLQVRRTGAAASTARSAVATGPATQGGPTPRPTPMPQPAPEPPSAQTAQGVEERTPQDPQATPADAVQAVLEAVARGEISPAEADDLLSRPPRQ